jgi:shikimate dehydrogenase
MRAAVLGHPVAHSLSPALHRAAYSALGLSDWRYDAVDVTEAELPSFVEGLSADWAGLSLTMPLKRAVVPLLSSLSPLAAALGVANTVTFAADRALVGDNTDVYGIVAALRSAGVSSVSSAVVLGGGATAASAVAALASLGCPVPRVAVRSTARAASLRTAAAELGATPVFEPWPAAGSSLAAEVVVSTVPAGAADAVAALVPDVGGLGVLLDVVYAPWPTELGRAWAAEGGLALGGFEMLLHQAVAQVRLMTGLDAPVEAMRAAGLEALTARLP